ncbi:MAG: Rieske 2Fe-2S domain-containing protein [Candidatus Promineifilaceae bacterium]
MTNFKELDHEGFYLAATSAEVVDGRITTFILDQSTIILTRINGAIHAFSAQCPHASGDLTQGTLHRGRIACPDHSYKFDIRTGFPIWPEDEVCRLRKYTVKEEAGQVFVKV